MSLSKSTSITTAQQINNALLEKVIIANDLSGLSPVEKVKHIKAVCESIGLNPFTKPIQLINEILIIGCFTGSCKECRRLGLRLCRAG